MSHDFSTPVPEPRVVAKPCPVLDLVWRTSGQLRSLSATVAEELATTTPTSSPSGWPLSIRTLSFLGESSFS